MSDAAAAALRARLKRLPSEEVGSAVIEDCLADDVVFALRDGELVLRERPITALGSPELASNACHQVSARLIRRYPGVFAPVTLAQVAEALGQSTDVDHEALALVRNQAPRAGAAMTQGPAEQELAELDVDVSIGARVKVPAHLVPDDLPKRLHDWPDELLNAVRATWAAETGLPADVYDLGLVEITDQRPGSTDYPSTY